MISFGYVRVWKNCKMSGKNQEKGILRWMKNFIFQIFSLTVETLTNLGGGGGGGGGGVPELFWDTCS